MFLLTLWQQGLMKWNEKQVFLPHSSSHDKDNIVRDIIDV